MLASTVLADCLAIGCKLSNKILFANDCIDNAIIPQHTITNINMLKMVFLNILPFRLRLIFRLWESAFFLVTSFSPFPEIFLMTYQRYCSAGKIGYYTSLSPTNKQTLCLIIYHKKFKK